MYFLLMFFNLNTSHAQDLKIDSTKAIEAYNKAFSMAPINLDSSVYYFQIASELSLPLGLDSIYLGSQNLLSFIYDIKGNYASKDSIINNAYNFVQSHTFRDSFCFKGNSFNNYGEFQMRGGNYKKAIKILNHSIKIFEDCIVVEKAYNVNLEDAYRNLSIAYQLSGELEKASDIQNQIIFNLKANQPSDYKKTETYALIKRSLGYIEHLRGNELDAIKYYKESIPTYRNLKENKEDEIVTAILYLTQSYINLGALDSAKQIVKTIFNYKNLKNKFLYRPAYNFLGDLDFIEENYISAKMNYERALEIANEQFKDVSESRFLSEQYFNLAKLDLHDKNYSEALQLNQKAVLALARNFTNLDWKSFPNAKQVTDYNYGLNTLNQKADILKAFSIEDNNIDYLKASLKCFVLIDSLVNLAKATTIRSESKLDLSSVGDASIEKSIDLCYLLFQKTNDKAYIDQAFNFMESNKGSTLLSEIDQNQILYSKILPESIVEKIDSLKNNITNFERGISQNSSDQNVGEREKLINLKANNSGALDKILEAAEKEFPQLKSYKNISQRVPLNDIQSSLIDKTVLQYYYGDSCLYLVIFNQAHKAFFKIDNSIEEQLNEYLEFINNPIGEISETERLEKQENAYSLSKVIFLDPINDFGLKNNRIVLIPDGLLSYLPFEALLVVKPNSAYAFDLNYLLGKFEFQYLYSSRLLGFKNAKAAPKKNFFGMAPSFKERKAVATTRTSCEGSELFNLACSNSEVVDIKQIYKGQISTEKEATKNEFINKAGDFNILHLATHACVDETNPRNSQIFFTDDYISNAEIQALKLNADLAVLSACNTGRGKIAKGEGVLSLSRDFIYAGCNSVNTSLWSVDDCSTSELMKLFYENLNAGERKTEALKNAKQSFFDQTTKDKTHPYYWAPFILVGDDAPIARITSNTKIWIWIIGGLLLLLFVFLKLKRN